MGVPHPQSSVEQSISNVNHLVNSQLPLFPESMIHHKQPIPSSSRIVYKRGLFPSQPYGVSRSRRILSPNLLMKKYDLVRECAINILQFSVGEREVVLRLLRLWAYYGHVYPKESQITAEPGCSKATYWRTVRKLRELELITVINRFIIRPHAQISNLYKFDRLLLIIARYLAEHGVAFYERWLRPYLAMPGYQFWPWLLRGLQFESDASP